MAAKRARAEGVDLVLSIGGGSALDSAKLVAYLARSDQPLDTVYGVGLAKGKHELERSTYTTTAWPGGAWVSPLQMRNRPSSAAAGDYPYTGKTDVVRPAADAEATPPPIPGAGSSSRATFLAAAASSRTRARTRRTSAVPASSCGSAGSRRSSGSHSFSSCCAPGRFRSCTGPRTRRSPTASPTALSTWIGSRGPIIDAKGRPLAGNDRPHRRLSRRRGARHDRQDGLAPDGQRREKLLQRLSRLAHVPVTALLTASAVRPALAVRAGRRPAASHERSLANYVDERAQGLSGFNGDGAAGAELPQGVRQRRSSVARRGEPQLLASSRYAHAKAGETVGSPASRRSTTAT